MNRKKSRVDRPWRLKLLGFSIYRSAKGTRIRVAPESYARLKDTIRAITSRSRGMAMGARIRRLNQYLRGWVGHFALADVKSPLLAVDEWLRRRLRQIRLKEWKRSQTRVRELVRLGVPKEEARKIAGSRKGTWHLSRTPQVNQALDHAYWRRVEVTFASDLYTARWIHRTARCGPACRVVGQDGRVILPPTRSDSVRRPTAWRVRRRPRTRPGAAPVRAGCAPCPTRAPPRRRRRRGRRQGSRPASRCRRRRRSRSSR